MRPVQYGAAGRREVLGTLVADIGLRRLQVAPDRRRLPRRGHRPRPVVADVAGAGLGQQLLDDPFRLLVVAFAELMMPDVPLRIDEVERRPIFVVERAPYRIVAVDRDRIVDPHVLRGPAHVVDVVLEGELGRVHADHHQPLIPVFLGPGADIGKRAQPVDAGVGPEVDEDDFSAQTGRRQRRRVEPTGRAAERSAARLRQAVSRRSRHAAVLSAAVTPGAASAVADQRDRQRGCTPFIANSQMWLACMRERLTARGHADADHKRVRRRSRPGQRPAELPAAGCARCRP